MDVRDLHHRAATSNAELIANVAPDQFDQATPCGDWDVRALVGHMIAGNHLYEHVARTGSTEGFDFTADFIGTDAGASFDASLAVADEAFAPDEVLTSDFTMPWATMPGEAAIGMHVVDLTTHAWDLAAATGQSVVIDDALVEYGLANSQIPDEFRGEGMPFGARIEVDAQASGFERMLAALGRDPNWQG